MKESNFLQTVLVQEAEEETVTLLRDTRLIFNLFFIGVFKTTSYSSIMYLLNADARYTVRLLIIIIIIIIMKCTDTLFIINTTVFH